jgi:hypothetical protein
MIRARRCIASWTFAIAVGAVPANAWGDDPSNAVAAQALFDDAKGRMERGDYESACPKLEESQRLQPAGGTLLFLGLCLEGSGKTAAAWARFNEALSTARRDSRADRERVAQQHIDTLAPKLTKLDVVVPDALRATPGLRVQRDGEDVPAAIWGTAIPVDPGSHTVRVTAPRMKPWETVVPTAGEGATATVNVPALEVDPTALAPVAAPPPPAPIATPPPPEPPPPVTAERSSGQGQRTMALVVGGVGVVGLGLGTYFGVTALSNKNSEDANGCTGGGSTPCASTTGAQISQDAYHDGNIASVALGVGAAALIGGGVLWLTAPSASAAASVRVAPNIGRGSASLGVTGAW